MKAKFGIEGLDKMLNGGLKKGRIYLLSGEMGTGKTLTAIKFLVEGIKDGDNCLYISVDKPPQLPIRMAARLKYNVSQLKIMDAVPSPDLYSTGYPVRDITAKGDISFAKDTKGERIGKGELTFEALQIKLNKVFNRTRYDRIVIDSFSTFKRFASEDFKRYTAIQQLFRFFINKGITILITVDDPKNEDISAEVILSTGIIYFYKEKENGKISKKIRIMKMRGDKYNSGSAEFYIDEDIIVKPPITKKDKKEVEEKTEDVAEPEEPEKEKKPKKKAKKKETTETKKRVETVKKDITKKKSAETKKEKKKPKSKKSSKETLVEKSELEDKVDSGKKPVKKKEEKKQDKKKITEKKTEEKETKEAVETKPKKTTTKKKPSTKPKKDKKKEKKSEKDKKKKSSRKKK